MPYTPLAGLLGFEPLSLGLLLAMLAVAVVYMLSAEAVKRTFYRAEKR
jgi:Mg2+-importing ATPase